MNAVQLLVTVALVGCGILIYDTVRGTPPAPAPAEVPVVGRPAPEATPDPVAPVRPALQGAGYDVLADRLAELEERLTGLEDIASREDTGAGSGLRRPERLPAFEPGEAVPSEFTPEEIAWFRALNEEVLRIRRTESEIRSIRAQLDRIRPDFPDDVRDDLVGVTRTFRAKKRELLGQALRERWPVERRTEALEAALDAYQEQVYRLAPADAEDIVQRFGNFPGSRRDGPFSRDR